VYLPLAGRRVVSWSFSWAALVPQLGRFVLVVRPQDVDLASETLRREVSELDVDLVLGGDSRHASEQAALDHLAPLVARDEIDVVAVHDGARPLAGPHLFESVVTTAAAVGGAVPALPADSVLAVRPDGQPLAAAAPGRDGRPPRGAALVRAQTPQAFRAHDLITAYRAATHAGYRGTDTASSVEAFSDLVVQVVAGSRQNLKVTYPNDLLVAERLLAVNHYRMS
jgi:2-C-methyl-D-erythritol 4-phosphate cytidylyltransferase